MSDFYSSKKIKKTRKSHTCFGCCKKIPTGSEAMVEKVIRCEVIGEIKPHKVVAIKKEKIISKEKLRKMKEVQEMWEVKRERNKQIIEDCKNGVSVADISKKYNLSRQGVYNVLAKGENQ